MLCYVMLNIEGRNVADKVLFYSFDRGKETWSPTQKRKIWVDKINKRFGIISNICWRIVNLS